MVTIAIHDYLKISIPMRLWIILTAIGCVLLKQAHHWNQTKNRRAIVARQHYSDNVCDYGKKWRWNENEALTHFHTSTIERHFPQTIENSSLLALISTIMIGLLISLCFTDSTSIFPHGLSILNTISLIAGNADRPSTGLRRRRIS